MERIIEIVASICDELKMLVGRGADLKWLARCFAIRKLIDVGVGTREMVAGQTVWEYLLEGINTLSGSYEFEGRWIDADELKPVFKKLLRRGGTAEIRRYDAIEGLKLYISEVTWRKDREWKFLYILADHLTTN